MDDFKVLASDMLPDEMRANLVAAFTLAGMSRDEANRRLDLACHATAEAYNTAFRIADSSPVEADRFYIMAIICKILSASSTAMFRLIKEQTLKGTHNGNEGIHP